jgi:ABC-type lipoprotein export system ATPase subunit
MDAAVEKAGVGPGPRQSVGSSQPRPSTSSTARNPEDLREETLRANPNGSTRATGVDVQHAEAHFAELQRELSHMSRASHEASPKDHEKTVLENGFPSSEETFEHFDLEAVLRGDLDAEREAGIRPKHIGVYWDGLTVKGMGGRTNYVKTFPDAFVDFFNFITPIRRLLGFSKQGVEATLLNNFKGVCEAGEMVLVLGKPGSGCTTFLKTIANQRYGYTGVTGEVLYGPFTDKEFIQYRGEAVYNEEDDVHHPTLTVEQTLGFALDVKIPGKLPAGITKQQFKEKVTTTLLKMFNIEHTRKTIVGNAFIRGVSGGERKRVSIAEMLVSKYVKSELCTPEIVLPNTPNRTEMADFDIALAWLRGTTAPADSTPRPPWTLSSLSASRPICTRPLPLCRSTRLRRTFTICSTRSW